MVAEDQNHTRNSLSNCGLRAPEYLCSSKAKGAGGIKGLMKAIQDSANGIVDQSQRLLNNEQLEFLGDAVLEFICR